MNSIIKINKIKTIRDVFLLIFVLLIYNNIVIAQNQIETKINSQGKEIIAKDIKVSSDCDRISDINERIDCLTSHIDNITESFDTLLENTTTDESLSLEAGISIYNKKLTQELAKIEPEKLKKLELLIDIILLKREIREVYSAFDNEINLLISQAITSTEQSLSRAFTEQEKNIYANNMKQFYYNIPDMILYQIKKKMIINYSKDFTDEDIDYFLSIYNDEQFKKLSNYNISLYQKWASGNKNLTDNQKQTKFIMDLALVIDGLRQGLLESAGKTRNELKEAGLDYRFLDALIIEYNKTSAANLAREALKTGNLEGLGI